MQAVNVKSIVFDSLIKRKTIKRNTLTGIRNPQKKTSVTVSFVAFTMWPIFRFLVHKNMIFIFAFFNSIFKIEGIVVCSIEEIFTKNS